MPKKHRSRKMRGGWPWDKEEQGSSSSEGSGWFDSLKKSASSATGSATSWFSSSTPTTSTTTTPSPTPSPTPTPTPTSSVFGGKGRRHKSRRMRGGYSDNVSMTNLASRAAPFSGSTARAQAYVGGKRSRRRHHKKSHRRHHRK
jgi:hypothetical protein